MTDGLLPVHDHCMRAKQNSKWVSYWSLVISLCPDQRLYEQPDPKHNPAELALRGR